VASAGPPHWPARGVRPVLCGLAPQTPQVYTPIYLTEKILGSRGALEGERMQVDSALCRSTIGSPRASAPPTCERPRRYSQSCHDVAPHPCAHSKRALAVMTLDTPGSYGEAERDAGVLPITSSSMAFPERATRRRPAPHHQSPSHDLRRGP
jgi:hypothetical protein